MTNSDPHSSTKPTSASADAAKKRKDGNFAADVFKLMFGTTFAQLLTAAATLLLARMFSPDAFGISALFVSITTILATIATLRYELAIMLPEDESEAANVLAVGMTAVVIVTTLSWLVIRSGQHRFVQWLEAPQLLSYLWLIPVTVFFGGVYQALNFWNSRTRHFGRLSISRVIQSLGTSGAQLGMGVAGLPGTTSLIYGTAIGKTVSALALGGQIWRDEHGLLLRSIRPSVMWETAIRFRKFPLFNTWATLLNTISWQLPAFMLSAYFSPVIVGYYALGNRLIRLPMNIIGGSITQVFYQRASEANKQGDLTAVVGNTFTGLIRLSFFPLLVLSLTGADIFAALFGAQWREAGVYTQILAVWSCFWFVSSPMATLYSVLERQEFSLRLNIAIFTSRLLALAIGGYVGNARFTMALYAGSGIIVYGYLSYAILIEAGVPFTKIVAPIREQLIHFLPVGALLIFLQWRQVSDWIILVTSTLIVGLYYLIETRRDPMLANMIRKQVRRGGSS